MKIKEIKQNFKRISLYLLVISYVLLNVASPLHAVSPLSGSSDEETLTCTKAQKEQLREFYNANSILFYDQCATSCDTQKNNNASVGEINVSEEEKRLFETLKKEKEKGGSSTEIAYRFFQAMGLKDFQAAAILGNWYAESGINPIRMERSQVNKFRSLSYQQMLSYSAGFGLAQWDTGRRTKLITEFLFDVFRGRYKQYDLSIQIPNDNKFSVNDDSEGSKAEFFKKLISIDNNDGNYSGINSDKMKDIFLAEVAYTWKELISSEKRAYGMLINSNSIEDATRKFGDYYERPANLNASINIRIDAAKKFRENKGANAGNISGNFTNDPKISKEDCTDLSTNTSGDVRSLMITIRQMSGGSKDNPRATQFYDSVIKDANTKKYWTGANKDGKDAIAFVSLAILASGYDNTIKMELIQNKGTGAALKEAISSNNRGSILWEKVDIKNESDLKPGDLAISDFDAYFYIGGALKDTSFAAEKNAYLNQLENINTAQVNTNSSYPFLSTDKKKDNYKYEWYRKVQ